MWRQQAIFQTTLIPYCLQIANQLKILCRPEFLWVARLVPSSAAARHKCFIWDIDVYNETFELVKQDSKKTFQPFGYLIADKYGEGTTF